MIRKIGLTAAVVAALGMGASLGAAGFGIQLGPFELGIDADFDGRDGGRARYFDDPICSAIARRNQIEMIIEWKETANQNDVKIVTKQLVVEPYLFGMSSSGKPVVKGNIVSEKMLQEISVRYGDQEGTDNKQQGWKGFFRPSVVEKKNVDTIHLQKVSEIRVIPSSSFQPPKKMEDGMMEGVARVRCSVFG